MLRDHSSPRDDDSRDLPEETMTHAFLRCLLLLCSLASLFACAKPIHDRTDYTLEVVFAGDGVLGLHGLAFDDRDRLYAGSVIGSAIHRVDTRTGATEVFISGPEGEADDLEFAPDGTLVWTSFVAGKVHAKKGEGPIRVLAEGLPGMNSLAFDPSGRLFATQVFLADALYEIDLDGEKPARKVLEGMGGLNGFDFGPDGHLYGPLWFKGQVARIDVDAVTLEVVADGFHTPAAVNFDSQGRLFALDTARGEIVRIDPASGEKTIVAQTPTTMDNLAIDSRDALYISVMPGNAIFEVDTETGGLREVRSTPLGIPSGLALARDAQGETLFVADAFAVRAIELPDHTQHAIARSLGTKLKGALGGISASAEAVHITSWADGSIQRIDRESGEIVTHHGFVTPADVLELADGSLLVAQAEPGEIVRVAPDGERRTVASGLDEPVALASGGAERAWVALRGSGGIEEIDLRSGASRVLARGLDDPEGLAIGPRGQLYVTEASARRISRIDPEDGRREVIASDLPIGRDMGSGLAGPGLPSGIAVASDGSVYFSSDVEGSLYRLRPEAR
jgi:sugar lactone lactonase YvrE